MFFFFNKITIVIDMKHIIAVLVIKISLPNFIQYRIIIILKGVVFGYHNSML